MEGLESRDKHCPPLWRLDDSLWDVKREQWCRCNSGLSGNYLFHFDVIISKDFFTPEALGPGKGKQKQNQNQNQTKQKTHKLVLYKCMRSEIYYHKEEDHSRQNPKMRVKRTGIGLDPNSTTRSSWETLKQTTSSPLHSVYPSIK